MKALLIEFSLESGRRAGNISPKDKGLKCYGWQDLDSRPAKEIRVIEDNRNTEQYEKMKGVTVLHTDEEIETTITETVPIKYEIQDELLFKISVEEKKLKLGSLAGKTREDIAKELHKKGVLGISERKPLKFKEVYGSK